MWTWVSRYHNVFILDFIGAKGDGGGGNNCSYNACKAPVKMSPPTNQHPTFYRPDVLPVAQPTASKHWRENFWHRSLHKIWQNRRAIFVSYLDALFDPEVSGHRLPVLWADDVEQPVEEAAADAGVEHFHELLPQLRLGTAKSAEERRLQLGRQLRVTQRIVPDQSPFHNADANLSYRIVRPSSSSEGRPRYELSVSKQLEWSRYMTVRVPTGWSTHWWRLAIYSESGHAFCTHS